MDHPKVPLQFEHILRRKMLSCQNGKYYFLIHTCDLPSREKPM